MLVRLATVRRKLGATTPGKILGQMIVVSALAGLLAVGSVLVGLAAASSANSIQNNHAALIVSARTVQTELARANAAAAATLLDGSDDWDVQRNDYDEALRAGAQALESAIAAAPDDDEALHEQLAVLTAAVPRYTGLIEAARANNRQGFPAGAAYLDEATALLETEIFPLTDSLANQAATSYRSEYDRHQGPISVAVGLLIMATLMLLWYLLRTQIWMARWFRRTVNPAVLATTVVVAGALLVNILLFVSSWAGLKEAREEGYDVLRQYLDIRTNSLAARADESRFLIARGAGESFEITFRQRADLVESALASEGPEAATSVSQWNEYRTHHERVVALARQGEHSTAVDEASDAGRRFVAFDEQIQELAANRRLHLEDQTASVANNWRLLSLIGPILAVIAAALALWGLQQRRAEYR